MPPIPRGKVTVYRFRSTCGGQVVSPQRMWGTPDAIATLPRDIAVLIIEHDMDVVFRFAKEITVLVQGAVFTQGTPNEIMNNEQVKAVYLGQEGHRGGHHG